MSQKPIEMEQLHQILQLKTDGVPIREISRRIGISRNSVRKYLKKLDTSTAIISSKELAGRVYDNESLIGGIKRSEELFLHFKTSCSDLSKTGVTRLLLWQEYSGKQTNGFSYSQYCHYLKAYLKKTDLAMHMEYKAGDIIMIDFAGKKLYYVDGQTGELIKCEVFVSILPYSGLIYCVATPSQRTNDFSSCINEMLKYYGGVPATLLCDNLKTAVIRPNRYEPVFTELCYQLGDHYHTTFSAARPYSPRDKAMVEGAVRIIYRMIYAPLRHQEFTSLETLNKSIQEQLKLLNHKPYKNTPYSRLYYFEQQEKSSLKQLPSLPFTAKKAVLLTVQRNYHVQLSENHHYYSVPYTYVGKKVKVLYDNHVVEVYFDNLRIALHIRRPTHKSYTTMMEHMPPHHQKMHQIKGWNKEDLLNQAARIGTNTHQAAALLLENSFYVEQNYKSCFGMLMLQKKYGATRLELACARIVNASRVNYTMIKNILERGLDKLNLFSECDQSIPQHENIRGKDHYQ